jgi:hypothetical protein
MVQLLLLSSSSHTDFMFQYQATSLIHAASCCILEPKFSFLVQICKNKMCQITKVCVYFFPYFNLWTNEWLSWSLVSSNGDHLTSRAHMISTNNKADMRGFGGLVVHMLASGTRVCGFKPGRSRRIFSGVKILSMPSFRREVKPSAPCCRFAAC